MKKLMLLLTILVSAFSFGSDELSLEERLNQRKEMANQSSMVLRIEEKVSDRVLAISTLVDRNNQEIVESFEKAINIEKEKAIAVFEELSLDRMLFETGDDLICEYIEDDCVGTSCDIVISINCFDNAGKSVVNETVDLLRHLDNLYSKVSGKFIRFK